WPFVVSCGLCGTTAVLHFCYHFMRVRPAAKSCRAKKNHRILNLLATEARQRLAIFGQDAQNSPIRTVEKWLVLVGQRRRFQFLICHELRSFDGWLRSSNRSSA